MSVSVPPRAKILRVLRVAGWIAATVVGAIGGALVILLMLQALLGVIRLRIEIDDLRNRAAACEQTQTRRPPT